MSLVKSLTKSRSVLFIALSCDRLNGLAYAPRPLPHTSHEPRRQPGMPVASLVWSLCQRLRATVVKGSFLRSEALPLWLVKRARIVWFWLSGLVKQLPGSLRHCLWRTGLTIIPACTHYCRLANRGRCPAACQWPARTTRFAAVLAMTRRRRPADPAGKAGMVQPG